MTVTSRFHWLPGALLLTSCASNVPVNIREAPPDNPLLDEVRTNAAGFESRQVRWGGEILDVENRQQSTLLSVLARPLGKGGEPRQTDNSQGRFIAHIPAFIDPGVYKAGRHVTVAGTLAGTETHNVGEYPYSYPVVEATDWYLWAERVPYPTDYYHWRHYDPWFYDPWFYDPWYPYPYYPRYRYH